jgi:alkylation response protein AidB-like acyl-CoA dehydrogenase
MDLELTDDQVSLRTVADDLLDARAPLSLARSFLDGHGDPTALWQEFAELGWYGVGSDLGGEDGFGLPGLCVLAAGIGGHAAPSLVADTVIVARIAAGGDGMRGRWAQLLADGTVTVALAHLEATGSWHLDGVTARASGSGSYVVNGTKVGVHHGLHAGAFAVTAVTDDGPALMLVPRDAAGVEVRQDSSIDPSSGSCTLRLSDVTVGPECVVASPKSGRPLQSAFEVGAVLSAAETLGAASKCLDMAVSYSRQRKQYGRAIGSFQALQHLLAERHVLRETAWSAILYAAAAIDDGLEESSEASSVAKAHAARAARQVVEGAMQVFGGVAFTWEHDVHLLARRALAAERRFGDALHHERVLSQRLATRGGAAARLQDVAT